MDIVGYKTASELQEENSALRAEHLQLTRRLADAEELASSRLRRLSELEEHVVTLGKVLNAELEREMNEGFAITEKLQQMELKELGLDSQAQQIAAAKLEQVNAVRQKNKELEIAIAKAKEGRVEAQQQARAHVESLQGLQVDHAALHSRLREESKALQESQSQAGVRQQALDSLQQDGEKLQESLSEVVQAKNLAQECQSAKDAQLEELIRVNDNLMQRLGMESQARAEHINRATDADDRLRVLEHETLSLKSQIRIEDDRIQRLTPAQEEKGQALSVRRAEAALLQQQLNRKRMERTELTARWEAADKQLASLQAERDMLLQDFETEYSMNDSIINATGMLEESIANLNALHQNYRQLQNGGARSAIGQSDSNPSSNLVVVPLVSHVE